MRRPKGFSSERVAFVSHAAQASQRSGLWLIITVPINKALNVGCITFWWRYNVTCIREKWVNELKFDNLAELHLYKYSYLLEIPENITIPTQNWFRIIWIFGKSIIYKLIAFIIRKTIVMVSLHIRTFKIINRMSLYSVWKMCINFSDVIIKWRLTC